jgi:hypothetical protein
MPARYAIAFPETSDRVSAPTLRRETVTTVVPNHPVCFDGTRITFAAHEPEEIPFLLALNVDGPSRCGCLDLYRALTEPGALPDRIDYFPLPFRTAILDLVQAQVAQRIAAAGMTVTVARVSKPDGLMLYTPPKEKVHNRRTTLGWFWLFDIWTAQRWRFNQLHHTYTKVAPQLFPWRQEALCALCALPHPAGSGAPARFREHLTQLDHVRRTLDWFTALNQLPVPVFMPLRGDA